MKKQGCEQIKLCPVCSTRLQPTPRQGDWPVWTCPHGHGQHWQERWILMAPRLPRGFEKYCKACGEKMVVSEDGMVHCPYGCGIYLGDEWRGIGAIARMSDAELAKCRQRILRAGQEPEELAEKRRQEFEQRVHRRRRATLTANTLLWIWLAFGPVVAILIIAAGGNGTAALVGCFGIWVLAPILLAKELFSKKE